MRVGEIYSFVRPSGNDANSKRHPFAIIEIDGGEIKCCMLTHSPTSSFPHNKQMQAEHFQENYPAVGIQPFVFDADRPSHFLSAILFKPSEFFDDRIARVSGNLTPAGLAFIEKHKKDIKPMWWRDYFYM